MFTLQRIKEEIINIANLKTITDTELNLFLLFAAENFSFEHPLFVLRKVELNDTTEFMNFMCITIDDFSQYVYISSDETHNLYLPPIKFYGYNIYNSDADFIIDGNIYYNTLEVMELSYLEYASKYFVRTYRLASNNFRKVKIIYAPPFNKECLIFSKNELPVVVAYAIKRLMPRLFDEEMQPHVFELFRLYVLYQFFEFVVMQNLDFFISAVSNIMNSLVDATSNSLLVDATSYIKSISIGDLSLSFDNLKTQILSSMHNFLGVINKMYDTNSILRLRDYYKNKYKKKKFAYSLVI